MENEKIKIIRDAVIAGVLIGIGCIVNLSVKGGLLGATLFSLGLISVVVQQRWLYTGKIGYLSKKQAVNTLLCLPVNLLAIGAMCWAFSRWGNLGLDTSALCQTKMEEPWYEAFVRSIGCGMLMYIAVEGYRRTNNLLAVVLPVIVFILSGFDHCIANYGYLTMNNIWWCNQLPVWIVGNGIGSLIISKI